MSERILAFCGNEFRVVAQCARNCGRILQLPARGERLLII
jgi:hypothetical protein